MDLIGDMLTRIRNGHARKKESVIALFSKTCESVLQVLLDEGYIRGFSREKNERDHLRLKVELKYYDEKPVIQKVARCSKPGRRVYSGSSKLKPHVNGLGIYVISTSQGVMSDVVARSKNIGGEILCSVF